jgi:hypothetical protein
MHLIGVLTLLTVQGQIPVWETDMGYIPLNGVLLAGNSEGTMDLFVPMGDHGLGGWTGTGAVLPGFPVSTEEGVTERPASFSTPGHEHTLVYADDEGWVHRIDHDGTPVGNWPVQIGPNIVTGISVVDLDADGNPDLAFGTADGRVHLLDASGMELPGWPIQLPSQIQWQPSQLSLGGGSGHGLVCALVSTSVYVLDSDGSVLPGWPVNTGYSAGSLPITADIDSDGLGDVLFATYNEKVYAVSMSGSSVPGWPVLLEDRAVGGAMAIGRLDPALPWLQVAVSMMDSTVTLINGDGSTAGASLWPNATDGRPTVPIIARTARGMAVIVGTDDGSVYAWNGGGEPFDGYPFDFGQMISRPPAAGDIDGDGNLELVVLGRSGKLGVYTISSSGLNPGPWPQTLFDEGNSGSYGTSFLPMLETGELTGEFSGDFTIPYQINEGDYTGISLAYSINAGFTWQESYSFTDNGSELFWQSRRDLPGLDVYECALKLTPLCSDGSGVSGISNIFHIDNNEPPEIYLASPSERAPGEFTLAYAVNDPEGDPIQLQSQYSLDNGVTWNTAHLSGSTYEITRWYYGEPVTWFVSNDMGSADAGLAGVSFRVRGADSDPGPWCVLDDFESSDSRLPCGQVITPDTEVSGRVSLGLRLSEPDWDPMDIVYEVSTDGGETWEHALISEATLPYQGSNFYRIFWESDADLPGFEGNRVRFRALLSENSEAVLIPSAEFHLDNNAAPTIQAVSPEHGRTYSGHVPVSIQLTDPEGGSIHVGLEYRLDDTEIWLTASGFPSMNCGPESYNSSDYWDSTEDLPHADEQEVDLRLTAFDGDVVYSNVISGVTINN